MTIRKLARLPVSPRGTKWVAQTVRLTDAENKRLKRAAKKQRTTFNAWAVTTLNEAADLVLAAKPQTPTPIGEPIATTNEQAS